MASRINTEGPRTDFVGSQEPGHQAQRTALLPDAWMRWSRGKGYLVFLFFLVFFPELNACDQIDGLKYGRTGKGVEGLTSVPVMLAEPLQPSAHDQARRHPTVV
jgi:hypothetical protein